RREWRSRNGSQFAYGPGRNDAFGVIFNQVLARALKIPSNATEPDAPASYPVVWDAPAHDFVQWNGLANNAAGPLARNLGQVLGVFGRINVHETTEILNGFCSSARRLGLDRLEDWLIELQSPKWPTEVLGELDALKIEKGSKLFQK